VIAAFYHLDNISRHAHAGERDTEELLRLRPAGLSFISRLPERPGRPSAGSGDELRLRSGRSLRGRSLSSAESLRLLLLDGDRLLERDDDTERVRPLLDERLLELEYLRLFGEGEWR
jgi:hypothetical protein